MKKIIFLVMFCSISGFQSFGQSNFYFENRNAFSISMAFEKFEDNNSFLVLSPFYSINGNFDFGLNMGYSLKSPNVFRINPQVYMRLFNENPSKKSFNFAYGLGYQYESSSEMIDNEKINTTANYFQQNTLFYYNIPLENFTFQPQLNIIWYLGESQTDNVTSPNKNNPSDIHPDSFADYKIGFAFIFNKDNFTWNLIPSIFLDHEGKTFALQVGVTF
jgi:hypothetical protein